MKREQKSLGTWVCSDIWWLYHCVGGRAKSYHGRKKYHIIKQYQHILVGVKSQHPKCASSCERDGCLLLQISCCNCCTCTVFLLCEFSCGPSVCFCVRKLTHNCHICSFFPQCVLSYDFLGCLYVRKLSRIGYNRKASLHCVFWYVFSCPEQLNRWPCH